MRIKSVLITDDIEQECIDILKSNGIHVVMKTNISKEQLVDEIQHYEALLVRSATKVTRQVLEAGKNLKLVGRAGTGVDNIDIDAANELGIVVMNTPAGNSRSAAELTCTMVLSMARHVPQAHQSMKSGAWARKDFMGNEVYGSVLAIIGIGRIGQLVAARMTAFGMRVIGYDPLVDRDTAASKFGIEWMSLDEIWPLADYISVHVPLIQATKNLINATTLSKCKRGVKLINVARGGIIDEEALVDALNSGVCSGAALDVFLQEPPTNRKLIDHARVICTPHLGASTVQAQQQVAREIAENIVALNSGVGLFGALNGAALVAMLDESSARWIRCTESLASIARTMMMINGDGSNHSTITMHYPKSLASICNALKTAVCVGMLNTSDTNLINADMKARKAGIEIDTVISDTEQIELSSTTNGWSVCGYASVSGGTVLTAIDHHPLPIVLTLISGTMLRIGIPTTAKSTSLVDVGMVGDPRRITVFNIDNDDSTSKNGDDGCITIRIT